MNDQNERQRRRDKGVHLDPDLWLPEFNDRSKLEELRSRIVDLERECDRQKHMIKGLERENKTLKITLDAYDDTIHQIMGERESR